MNGMLVGVLAIILFFTWRGWRKGFIRILFGLGSMLLSAVLVSYLLPYVNGAVRTYTSLDEVVEQRVEEEIREQASAYIPDSIKSLEQLGIDVTDLGASSLSGSQQTEVIENAAIPSFLKALLKENNNSAVYEKLGVSNFTEYLKTYIAGLAVNIVAFLLTWIIVWLILRVILIPVNVVAKLPVIRGVNGLIGGVLGAAEGLFIVCLGFLVLYIFFQTQQGTNAFSQIESSTTLLWLYEHNPLLGIVTNLTKWTV